MKHFLKIANFLAILLFISFFMACSNPNSSNVNSSTPSFEDCTTIVNEVTISDGNWTMKAGGSETSIDGKFTVSNGTYNYTSGSFTLTIDFSKMMKPDVFATFKNLSEEEKKAYVIENGLAQENVEITFNGNVAKIKQTYSNKDLNNLKKLDFSSLSDDAIIKTNSNKTKYVIIDTIFTFYLSKD